MSPGARARAGASPNAVLEAVGLKRDYAVGRGMFRGSATLQALRGVSFSLDAGRTLAVVGESGCGKSTLARLVTLIEPPSDGRLAIDGIDAATASAAERRRLRRAVQIVFQDPYGSLNPRKKVSAILEEPLVISGDLGAAERREAVRDMMARVGLRPEQAGRYPHMFSGGQRQRIAIARALMLRPKIVVLDEPVSALDVSIQAQVLNLLVDLQEEFGLAYMFISHDLNVVRHIADEVAVMYLGRIIEHGPRDNIFRSPLHPYTRALQASSPSTDPNKRSVRAPIKGELPSPLNPPSGCAFHPRCPYADERTRREVPELKAFYGSLVACHAVEEGRLPDLPPESTRRPGRVAIGRPATGIAAEAGEGRAV
ncbi:MAG TPA: dipeptide ABC transporter ATP-binding protein [Geminicoccaceae bacterium]|nr:dipeptide ABC transporter ATP-binding protein [Geminicoccaceae bacterium]